MSTNPMNSDLSLGLLDSICHALQRGYQLWSKGQQTRDIWTLKESIIWIHHGVELALKQLLVQENEFLVFERVDDAVRQLAHLRKQPNLDGAEVLDLFEHHDAVRSVSFHKLVQRAAVVLNIVELSEGSPLRSHIDDLTIYRNRLVHFLVVLNVQETNNLLSDLLEPLLTVLGRKVNNADFVQNCIPEVRRLAKPVQRLGIEFARDSERRILKLTQRFDGRQVPGQLLGREGDFYLPVFTHVVEASPFDKVDLVAHGRDEDWIVEVKLRLSSRLHNILDELEQAHAGHQDAKVWLVVMSDISQGQKYELTQRGYLVSGLPEIVRLEEMLS